MLKKILPSLSIVLAISTCTGFNKASSFVIKESGKIYIVDRTGERWDVTQAESLGFKPESFQYGLGRNAFTPLDDTFLTDDQTDVPQALHVIGISEDSQAHAYSVPRLSSHEIANSYIGVKPIAVGF